MRRVLVLSTFALLIGLVTPQPILAQAPVVPTAAPVLLAQAPVAPLR